MTADILPMLQAYSGLQGEELAAKLARYDLITVGAGVLLVDKNEVHIMAPVQGLAGRKLLREVAAVLRVLLDEHGRLVTAIPAHNDRCRRFAKAFGFRSYGMRAGHHTMQLTEKEFHHVIHF